MQIYYTYLKHDFIKPNGQEENFIHLVLIHVWIVKYLWQISILYSIQFAYPHIPEAHFQCNYDHDTPSWRYTTTWYTRPLAILVFLPLFSWYFYFIGIILVFFPADLSIYLIFIYKFFRFYLFISSFHCLVYYYKKARSLCYSKPIHTNGM